MVERQPSWDKYEAAILLEGLLTSMKGELTRSDAIKAVSRDLRAMALHRGMEVDEVYRNTNGISFQMKSMESAYLGRKVFKPATKLFADVAGLYRAIVDQIVDVPDKADTRDTEAVKRIATAYLKLLFPNVRSAQDINPKRFQQYCLRPAVRMRKIIKRQLGILDVEFKGKDVPSFSLKEISYEN